MPLSSLRSIRLGYSMSGGPTDFLNLNSIIGTFDNPQPLEWRTFTVDPYSNIRTFNNLFQMTSFRALETNGQPMIYKIRGQRYHSIGTIQPQVDHKYINLLILFGGSYQESPVLGHF